MEREKMSLAAIVFKSGLITVIARAARERDLSCRWRLLSDILSFDFPSLALFTIYRCTIRVYVCSIYKVHMCIIRASTLLSYTPRL